MLIKIFSIFFNIYIITQNIFTFWKIWNILSHINFFFWIKCKHIFLIFLCIFYLKTDIVHTEKVRIQGTESPHSRDSKKYIIKIVINLEKIDFRVKLIVGIILLYVTYNYYWVYISQVDRKLNINVIFHQWCIKKKKNPHSIITIDNLHEYCDNNTMNVWFFTFFSQFWYFW